MGLIPLEWQKVFVSKPDIKVGLYIADLKERVVQLEIITKDRDRGQKGLALGKFFQPEAFVTASRQQVAERNKCSLEELVPYISVRGDDKDPDTWVIKEMLIEGAQLVTENLEISQNRLQNPLENVYFRWVKAQCIKGLTLPI